MSDLPLLSLVIWLPIIGGLVVLAVGAKENNSAARWSALVVSVITFQLLMSTII